VLPCTSCAITKSIPQKHPCDDNASIEDVTDGTCDGEEISDGLSDHEEGRDSDTEGHNGGSEKDNTFVTYQILEEGEAFLKTAFASRLKHQTRQAKLAKYGTPDCK